MLGCVCARAQAAGGAPRGRQGAGGGRGAGGGAPRRAGRAGPGATGPGASGEPGAEPGAGTMDEDDSYGQYGPRPGRRTPSPSLPPFSGPAPCRASGGLRFPGTVVPDASLGRPGRAGTSAGQGSPGARRLKAEGR